MNLVPLNYLLNLPKYRKLSKTELSRIILFGISTTDYNKLEGKYSFDKAKILYEKWHRK